MQWHEFQDTAERLARGATEGDWRSAISRAYYAVFHYFREFLMSHGLDIGRGGQSHNSLHVGLRNCGLAPLVPIANAVDNLRARRTDADYELKLITKQADASAAVQRARKVVTDFQVLLANVPASSIVSGMRGHLRAIGRLGRIP